MKSCLAKKPKGLSATIVEKDQPKLECTELLDQLGLKHYQSLIGALHRLVSLGRHYFYLGVATMSSFHVAPRLGRID